MLVLVISLLLVVVAVFSFLRPDERVRTAQTPVAGLAPEIVSGQTASAGTEPGQPAAEGRITEEKIGEFRRPEDVPEYRVLEEQEVSQDSVLAARLLVDTGARSESEYELITRDLKSRYADHDAVSIEFTDAKGPLGYNGGALIFNTIEGSSYVGYLFAPPNTKGYYVRSVE